MPDTADRHQLTATPARFEGANKQNNDRFMHSHGRKQVMPLKNPFFARGTPRSHHYPNFCPLRQPLCVLRALCG